MRMSVVAAIQCSAMQCSAVQCSAVRCSAVHKMKGTLFYFLDSLNNEDENMLILGGEPIGSASAKFISGN